MDHSSMNKLKNTGTDKGRLNKINKEMVGFILRGWLAGVSLGPKSNQKKYCFEEKNTKMIRMV